VIARLNKVVVGVAHVLPIVACHPVEEAEVLTVLTYTTMSSTKAESTTVTLNLLHVGCRAGPRLELPAMIHTVAVAETFTRRDLRVTCRRRVIQTGKPHALRNIQGTFRERFWEHSRNIQGTFREQSGHKNIRVTSSVGTYTSVAAVPSPQRKPTVVEIAYINEIS
jgi:hypothetical protein